MRRTGPQFDHLIGNNYAAKSRALEQTLKRCVAQDDGKRLRAACEAVLTKASKGDLAAFQVLADRLDGKVRSDDSGGDSDSRSIPLSALVSAILAARKAEAIDATEAIAPDDQPAILPPVSQE